MHKAVKHGNRDYYRTLEAAIEAAVDDANPNPKPGDEYEVELKTIFVLAEHHSPSHIVGFSVDV